MFGGLQLLKMFVPQCLAKSGTPWGDRSQFGAENACSLVFGGLGACFSHSRIRILNKSRQFGAENALHAVFGGLGARFSHSRMRILNKKSSVWR